MSLNDSVAFDFSDLKRKEVPVRGLFGKDYVLTEASEGTATEYRVASLRGAEMTLNEGGGRSVKRIEGTAEVEPLLISKCLHEVGEDGVLRLLKGGEPDPQFLMPLRVVRALPSRVAKELFEAIKRISNLGEGESAERAAVLALAKQPGGPEALEVVRSLAKSLAEAEPKTYNPLAALLAPDDDAKNRPAPAESGN